MAKLRTRIVDLLAAALLTSTATAAPPAAPPVPTADEVLAMLKRAESGPIESYRYERTRSQSPLIAADASLLTRDPFLIDDLDSTFAQHDTELRSRSRAAVLHDRMSLDTDVASLDKGKPIDGVQKCTISSWESPAVREVRTSLGWFGWFPGSGHHEGMSVTNTPRGLGGTDSLGAFSRSPQEGGLSDLLAQEWDHTTLLGAHWNGATLTARFETKFEQDEAYYPDTRVSTTVELDLADPAAPRLLGWQDVLSCVHEGRRINLNRTRYRVRSWLEVGGAPVPQVATADRFLYHPELWSFPTSAYDWCRNEWCPSGSVSRGVLEHTAYCALEPAEAETLLTEIPQHDGLMVFVDPASLTYRIGSEEIWIDGQHYSLPSPITAHPVDGLGWILEHATPTQRGTSFNHSAPVPDSKIATDPATSSKRGSAILVGCGVLLGTAGLFARARASRASGAT